MTFEEAAIKAVKELATLQEAIKKLARRNIDLEAANVRLDEENQRLRKLINEREPA